MIDRRPETPLAEESMTANAPSLISRYFQVALPVWELIVAMSASLKKSEGMVTEVLEFITVHKRLISNILKNREGVATMDAMKELRWVTAVFHRLSSFASEMQAALGERYPKYTSLMMQLLLKYADQRRVLPLLQPASSFEAAKESTPMPSFLHFATDNVLEHEASLLCSHIVFNCISFCRTIMQRTSREGHHLALFSATESAISSLRGVAPTTDGAPQMQPITELFSFLEREDGLLHQLQMAVKHRNILARQNPAELTAEHKKELISFVADPSSGGVEFALVALEELLKSKSKECAVHFYVLEQCLMILWLFSKSVPLQSLLRVAKRLNSVLDQVRDHAEVKQMAGDDRFVEQVIAKMKDRLRALSSKNFAQ